MIRPRGASITDLRRELAAAGLGPRGAGRVLAKLGLLLSISAAFFALALAAPAAWLAVPVLAIASWFYISAVMCGHDGSHGAVSRRRRVNDLVAWTGFTLLGGLSNYYWRAKHNLAHHTHTNVDGADPDVDNFPFGFSREQHARVGPLRRRFQDVQAWLFMPLAALLLTTLMRAQGIRAAVRGLVRGPHRGYAAVDLAVLAVHHAAWVVAILAGAPVAAVVTIFLAIQLFGGLYLTAVFAPAHMNSPLVGQPTDDFLRLQLETTRNLSTSRFFRWTMIGLDQQIEHHIAPRIPHFDLPRARPIVRAFCARHGLPYVEGGWARSLLAMHLRLSRVGDLAEIVIGDPPLAVAA
jgi:fatty acid desaturase